MERAAERLAAARYLEEGDFLDDAVSRVYYAMAHAAEAALTEYEIAPKTHKGFQTQFGKQVVKSGRLPAKMGRRLRRTFDLRQIADYAGTGLSSDTVRSLIEQADEFVQIIESHLASETDS